MAAKKQPRICDKMETNRIIEELRAKASLDWNPEQKAWFEQQANDARPVQCVRMRDAFTPEQLQFLFKNTGYKTQQAIKNHARRTGRGGQNTVWAIRG